VINNNGGHAAIQSSSLFRQHEVSNGYCTTLSRQAQAQGNSRNGKLVCSVYDWNTVEVYSAHIYHDIERVRKLGPAGGTERAGNGGS